MAIFDYGILALSIGGKVALGREIMYTKACGSCGEFSFFLQYSQNKEIYLKKKL